jgi:hypothetical protein
LRGSLRWESPKEIGKIHGNLGPVQTLFETRSTVSPRISKGVEMTFKEDWRWNLKEEFFERTLLEVGRILDGDPRRDLLWICALQHKTLTN